MPRGINLYDERLLQGTLEPETKLYVDAVQLADGQALEVGIKVAADDFIKTCKQANIWSLATQLLFLCGPRTLAGALVPIKGVAPTNVGGNFTTSNYSRTTGLGKASNSNAYLNSNIPVSALQSTDHALFGYGNFASISGDRIVIGRYGGSSDTLISLDEWAGYVSGRAFRDGTQNPGQFSVSTSTAPATCMIGSRTSATVPIFYIDGVAYSAPVSLPLTLSSQNLYIFALNFNNSPTAYSSSNFQMTGIFSSGLNGGQAATLRSAAAAYVAAVTAAITLNM